MLQVRMLEASKAKNSPNTAGRTRKHRGSHAPGEPQILHLRWPAEKGLLHPAMQGPPPEAEQLLQMQGPGQGQGRAASAHRWLESCWSQTRSQTCVGTSLQQQVLLTRGARITII